MGIIDLVFPRSCLGCKKSGVYICALCIQKLQELTPLCAVCEKASVDGVTHFKCKRPLGLDGLLTLWPYEGVVRRAIIGLKYKYAREVGDELRKYASKELEKYLPILPKDIILVPIPLYWYKENLRGFNQTAFLGKFISQKVGWDFLPDLLVRKRHTRAQTELRSEERKKNIRGVFSLNPIYKLPATSYFLFDDVYTTGSTIKEACKVLKTCLRRQGSGAGKVWGLTIAR